MGRKKDTKRKRERRRDKQSAIKIDTERQRRKKQRGRGSCLERDKERGFVTEFGPAGPLPLPSLPGSPSKCLNRPCVLGQESQHTVGCCPTSWAVGSGQ